MMKKFAREKLLKAIYLWKNYLRGGWNSKMPHHAFFKLAALRRGFSPDSLFIYRQMGWRKRDVISDYRRALHGPFINARCSYILDDKLVFDRFFADAIHYAYHVFNGQLLPHPEAGGPGEDLLPLLRQGKKFIVKPRRGGGGSRVRLLKHDGGSFWINDRPFAQADFDREIRGYHDDLIYPFFEQSGFSHEIYPATLNTIRILSIVDPQDKQPFVARALHRFGTDRSAPVDNWTSGGICADVDVASGTLSRGVIFPFGKKLAWHADHPDSRQPIAGRVIPGWQSILEKTLAAHRQIVYLPYIGWDMVLSANAIVILEANSNSDVNLFQVHRPLLADERLRGVFRHYRLAGK
jgi:hypothetical protein